jgi:DNA gyrase subunit B
MGHREYVLSDEVVLTGEFRQLRTLYPHLKDLTGTIQIAAGSSTMVTTQRRELLDSLLEAGRKGVVIQRYKGLGEMNPGQLWETTMDPDRRSMVRVSAQDATEADGLFTILMGDAVEPRRLFIEENALEVRNLDV